MRSFTLFIGASLIAFAGSALAQTGAETDSGSTAESPASSDGGLAEIIVTAQRRSENLQRAAVPLTAVGGEDIAQAGITNPNDLTKLVPALQVSTSSGAIGSFFIRGVGKVASNSQIDSAVLVNIDGVSLGRSGNSNGYFYDLDRVEVLKGPQGTLYGRNATGGAINIITRKPSFDSLGGFLEGEAGNFDAFRVTGALNVPLSENVAIRASGQLVRRDGYLSDGTQDEESEAARLLGSFRFGEQVRLLVGADYFHLGGRGPGSVLIPFTDPDNRRIGQLDPRSIPRQTAVLVGFAGNFLPALPTDTFIDSVNWGVYSQLDVETGVGTFTVIPAYREINPRFRQVTAQLVDQDESAHQFSVEARLASDPDKPLKYLLGVYYFDEKVHYDAGFQQGFNSAYRDVTLPTKSYAAFGRLNYSITPELRIDGGVRYTHDKKSISTRGYNVRVVCPAGPVGCIGGPAIPFGLFAPSVIFSPTGTVIPAQPFGTTGNILTAGAVEDSNSDTFSADTYHVGVEYDLAPRSLVYLSYDTGFKAGGFFSTIPGDPASFDPERINAFTLGSKNRFFDNKLQLNLELFLWRYRDQQVSFFSTNSAGGIEFRTDNIGKSTMKGIEIDSQFAATRNTLLRANIQYLDAKNKEFVYRVFNPGPPGVAVPPTTGCPVTLVSTQVVPVPGAFFSVDCSGTRPTMTSKWTLSFGGEQRVPLGNFGEVVIDVSTRYQSRYNSSFELLPTLVQPGFWTTDASVTFNARDDRYFISAFVRNLEDNTPIALGAAATQTRAYGVGYLRPPRTYGVRAGARF